MSKSDIKDLRVWQVQAANRAKSAVFDIVYVYAGHAYLPFQFITPRFNQRRDEYGGSLHNRVRLFREMIEETKEAVGDRCAVAVRFAVHEFQVDGGISSDGEGREVIEMLADLQISGTLTSVTTEVTRAHLGSLQKEAKNNIRSL